MACIPPPHMGGDVARDRGTALKNPEEPAGRGMGIIRMVYNACDNPFVKYDKTWWDLGDVPLYLGRWGLSPSGYESA